MKASRGLTIGPDVLNVGFQTVQLPHPRDGYQNKCGRPADRAHPRRAARDETFPQRNGPLMTASQRRSIRSKDVVQLLEMAAADYPDETASGVTKPERR